MTERCALAAGSVAGVSCAHNLRSPSIGVAAAHPGPGQRDYKVLAERLMAEADAALYRAKSAGRNRIATSPNIVT